MKTLQRSAQAIWALNEDTDCPDYELLSPHAMRKADGWARAGIEALRDPPDNILLVLGEPYGGAIEQATGLQYRRESWNKMIDAILAEVSA